MEKTMRITKAMRYADLKAMLNGEAVTYGTTLADALAFIDKEVSLLAKKNSGEKKPTKAQEENEGYKALILATLRLARAQLAQTFSRMSLHCPTAQTRKSPLSCASFDLPIR